MKFDLNCDLGEGEPIQKTRALMGFITSANIACAGHAGDLRTMRQAVRLATRNGVYIGAHPGLPDRANFGRAARPVEAGALQALIFQQVTALEKIARRESARLHHVKLHGALYHMVEEQPALRRAFVGLLVEFWPGLIVYCRHGGVLAKEARRRGLEAWTEDFLDRGRAKDGSLIPRGQPGAILSKKEFLFRLVSALDRSPGPGSPRTWCIHSDTPFSVAFAALARRAFEARFNPAPRA